ncbi:MAG: pyrroline-5-carboxylate reductase [Saprospiraceae bacterium]|nr:pyrroline-5-carboxylate reductase [Saprospirales bacterium]RMD99467.1 MAG: pyrroline-5-carboxylate reductase [Bacteroidota bacterium]
MKILIIGGGNMGMTYAHSFLRSHICDRQNLMILEKSAERSYELTKDTEFNVYAEPEGCINLADLIILAVKPQDSPELFERLRPLIDTQQVVLSIMAGVRMNTIAENLGTKKVIRAMPNLPSQVGMGMTVFTSTEEVTRIELVMVQNLINTTGKSLYVSDEAMIDAATAISGSGPAYVWYFMKALIEAGRSMGFSESEAEMLVAQTFRGAIDLFQKTDFSCEEWIKKVASKGGTTEAALSAFEETALYQDIITGANAALKRAEDLGKAADQS